MRFTEFAEDQFGTNPRRAARAGARHPRGHEPVERYHTVREFAPGGSGDSGDYLRALASAWYNDTFNTGSLPKGIKTQEDVERLLNRGIVCPDGATRKLHIDYNSDFDGVEIYSDDYYNHGDESGELDSRTGQPWGPYDHIEFKDEELDEGVAEGALNEFAPDSFNGRDDGEDPYQLRHYKHSIDFFDQFDSDGVDKQNFDKATGEYEGYYFDRDAASGVTQVAYFKFDDPTKIGDNDPGAGWYYEPIDEGVAEGSLNEFAPDDSGDSGEDDVLHKYARMWWAGDDATQQQIERILDRMGWEIGQDEGGYDNGGVFVVRAGDVNGNSYISWPAEELDEGAPVTTTPGSIEPGGAVDNFKQQMANRTEIDYLKNLAGIKENRDACAVCGQTPCNCTH